MSPGPQPGLATVRSSSSAIGATAAPIRLVLEGAHVEAEDPGFRRFLFDLITHAPGCVIQLDMLLVPFIDSAMLGTLVTAYKGAVVTGGCVEVTAASPHVRSVLGITGTDVVLLAELATVDGGMDGVGPRPSGARPDEPSPR